MRYSRIFSYIDHSGQTKRTTISIVPKNDGFKLEFKNQSDLKPTEKQRKLIDYCNNLQDINSDNFSTIVVELNEIIETLGN